MNNINEENKDINGAKSGINDVKSCINVAKSGINGAKSGINSAKKGDINNFDISTHNKLFDCRKFMEEELSPYIKTLNPGAICDCSSCYGIMHFHAKKHSFSLNRLIIDIHEYTYRLHVALGFSVFKIDIDIKNINELIDIIDSVIEIIENKNTILLNFY